MRTVAHGEVQHGVLVPPFAHALHQHRRTHLRGQSLRGRGYAAAVTMLLRDTRARARMIQGMTVPRRMCCSQLQQSQMRRGTALHWSCLVITETCDRSCVGTRSGRGGGRASTLEKTRACTIVTIFVDALVRTLIALCQSHLQTSHACQLLSRSARAS